MRNSLFLLSKQKPWLNDERRSDRRLKSIYAKLAILALITLMSGCSSIDKFVQDGIGQSISTVIDSSGPPTRVASDGRGGKIYIWEHWVDRGYGDRYLWSTMFWTDSNGTIYKWR